MINYIKKIAFKFLGNDPYIRTITFLLLSYRRLILELTENETEDDNSTRIL